MANVNQVGNTLNDVTGSGKFVGDQSPTLVTPNIGVATATSVNKVNITEPATGSTVTVADGKTLTCSNTLTMTGTDGSSIAFGAGGTVLYSGTAITRVIQQVFTSSGTYTPTSGMLYCIAEAQAGGGGGGGCSATAGLTGQGAGGGGGGYAKSVLTAADIGASQTVTIGAAGAGGSAGNNNGSAGGTTSLGTLLITAGGTGGTGMAGTATAAGAVGGAAGGVSAGQIQIPGQSAGAGVVINGANGLTIPCVGGSSQLGRGGVNYATGQGTGASGEGYGSGAAGAYGTGANQAGGNGRQGIIIITEFCS